MSMANTALLGNSGSMTSFSFGPHTIRFRTSRHLRRYTDVKEWDNGYLVVTADYDTLGETEEYIDLVPILRDLFFEPDAFLAPIERVSLSYA